MIAVCSHLTDRGDGPGCTEGEPSHALADPVLAVRPGEELRFGPSEKPIWARCRRTAPQRRAPVED